MAYDQTTRNRLQRFVSEARNLLSEEFTRQFQQKYGLDASSGEVSELERLVHLDDRELETARMLRGTLAHYLASSPSGGKRECLERMIREQAFTVLNRLSALRMAEAREIIIESLSRTYNSKGFQLYARLAGTALGDTGEAYRTYIFSVFDELALDLPVLFDRFSSQGCIFPGEGILLEFLTLMNESDLSPLWAEDETIGWIYQYFNTLDERRQMRSESQAPRNSRELAVRNQFFTPRYVVEFLTDNTLGCLWYEMTRGITRLKDSCRYMVRRPHEIFLAAGEEALEMYDPSEDQNQEKLVQEPVYIPYRRLKDPREIFMLDPACGSMHFGLYAFDLFEKIYEEAWELESQLGSQAFERGQGYKALQQNYTNKEEFLRDVPRLIVECNIHGVDIDLRAVQIAGLSLWLRAQRSWHAQGVKPLQRPEIRKSNIVCAEPMPGEKVMLEEFARDLKPKVLGQLMGIIFEKMQLAGEAGSLLKIEEEIEESINLARMEFHKELQIRNQDRSSLFPDTLPLRQQGQFDFTDLADKTLFWSIAEQKLLDALKDYAEQAEETEYVQKRLFAHDTAQGFAFIDLFQKLYDVVLMNPPFGESAREAKKYITEVYARSKQDLACAFVDRFLSKCASNGLIGVISTRTPFFLTSSKAWRDQVVLGNGSLEVLADLGHGVLDAMVETAAYVISNRQIKSPAFFMGLIKEEDKAMTLATISADPNDFRRFMVFPDSLKQVPGSPFSYWVDEKVRNLFTELPTTQSSGITACVGLQTSEDFRFVRLWWEVPINNQARSLEDTLKGKSWVPFAKGGAYSPYYADIHLVVNWKNEGIEIKEWVIRNSLDPTTSHWSRRIANSEYYFRPGLTWTHRTTSNFSIRVLPTGCIFGIKGPSLFGSSDEELIDLLLIMQSRYIQKLLDMSVGAADVAAKSYDVGIIQRLPRPKFRSNEIEKNIIRNIISLYQQLDELNESSHLFLLPDLTVAERSKSLLEKFMLWQKRKIQIKEQIGIYQDTVNQIALKAYGLDLKYWSDSNYLKSSLLQLEDELGSDDTDKVVKVEGVEVYIENIISWVFGIAFGRFDMGLATVDLDSNRLTNPFDSLPYVSRGMTREITDNEIVVQPEDILVDCGGNIEDIIFRVRTVMKKLFGEHAGEFEQEACEILRVETLRDYFRKPSNFFTEHLKRYSKSRRQAPIYWPLSTFSGSYTIWLYYQRLSDQILYRCINDYVEPKLKQLMESTRQLRQKTVRSRLEEKELEELLNLEQELQEFRDELLRVASFWKPDINDGVQITAAPLWKLFRLPKWRTTLKETWEKLQKGDFDWAHMAYSIWPERVREKCKHDKSLAIAHNLEDIYEEPIAQAKKKGRGKEKYLVGVRAMNSIQEFIKQQVILLRMNKNGVLTVYDPERRYRELCLDLNSKGSPGNRHQ